jgi:hypothetical protein
VLSYKDAKLPADPAGTHQIYINDIKVAETSIVKSQANIRVTDEINVGKDLITPVSDKYKGPFTFTGKIHSVIVESGTSKPLTLGDGKCLNISQTN